MTDTVPPGLRGVVVADTVVGDVRGDEGFYHYRQYAAVELAERVTLEDVWFLLFEGHLPSPAERLAFAAEVAAARRLPPAVTGVLPALAAAARRPLDAYRAAVAVVAAQDGTRPLMDLTAAERRADAVRLVAVTPVLLAAVHRLAAGLEPVPWREGVGWAAAYLEACTGTRPGPVQARALERYLVSTVDHGFNASTFTARVVTSTGADLASAVIAATGALSGPRHGGAPSRALDLLDEIAAEVGEGAEEDAVLSAVDRIVGARLAAGERIPGFGHAVYRTDDPRSSLLRRAALGLGGPLADRAVTVEARVLDLLARHRPGRVLPTNVELYAAVVMESCGLPRSMFTPTFTSSRVIGWCAHILEQAADPAIIRPAARYTGPPPPAPVPHPEDLGGSAVA